MLKNASLLAIVAVDTAENEPIKVGGRFHSFFIRHLTNFQRLVLGCIEASDRERVGAFFSIFRDLQDLHAFAPLKIQISSKLSKSFTIFVENFVNFAISFFVLQTDFNEHFSEFHGVEKNSQKFARNLKF